MGEAMRDEIEEFGGGLDNMGLNVGAPLGASQQRTADPIAKTYQKDGQITHVSHIDAGTTWNGRVGIHGRRRPLRIHTAIALAIPTLPIAIRMIMFWGLDCGKGRGGQWRGRCNTM